MLRVLRALRSELLHRFSRHDLNTLDHHALCRLARFALCISLDRRVANFLQHVIAPDQRAESRVLMIEPMYRRETDEELRSGRIWIGRARHGDHTAIVRMIVKFGLDFVIRTALSVTVLFRGIFRIWIATLDHEVFDDSVENRPIVETLSRQFLEILDRVWRSISPKLHHHFAFVGFDYCDFV